MLRVSTLIAIIGIIVNYVFLLGLGFRFFEIPREDGLIIPLITVIYGISLLQFFVVFYMKLSATKK